MSNFNNNFDKNVPFDPGYSTISFSFDEQSSYLTNSYNQVKAPHQKKFQLNQLEHFILDLINKSTAFYLGCILWGGFIHYRFKDQPKDITGNNTKDMSAEELQSIDCAAEAKNILQYIESFDRDCKYFLKRPAKISNSLTEILNSYIEFAKLNNNFINVENTKDIKIPQSITHFEYLSNGQLDKLYEKICQAITSNKIESLLELGFYKV